jgi:hypothetical protein
VPGDFAGTESEVDTLGNTSLGGLTHEEKDMRKEESHTNMDLVVFERALVSLGEGKTPPYRDSKLTQLLRPLLQPDNWMNMHLLATVSLLDRDKRPLTYTLCMLDHVCLPPFPLSNYNRFHCSLILSHIQVASYRAQAKALEDQRHFTEVRLLAWAR